MKLVYSALAAAYTALADNSIKVTCNNDNSINVAIAYDKKAELLEFSYGTCNGDSTRGVEGKVQDSDFNWNLRFDSGACGMDSKLRTIDYEQKASFRVGRKSAGGDITLANFEANSWCSYTAKYTVTFDYGNLTTEAHSFDTSGGVTALDFKIKSYDALFTESATAPTQGGDTIHLGLTVENKNFKHADHLWTGESGKVFAPVSCNVNDKTNNLKYTLFDTADSCSNDDVDLKVNFNEEANMWTFTHTLFLLGNFRKSSFELSCDVIVCEKSGDSAGCNAVAKSCLAVDGAVSEWAAWSSCSATCGSGSRSRARTCTNPAPAYGGADCTKALTEDEACKDKECPIHGKWSEYGQYSACSVTCGSGSKTRSRTCTNPAPAHGGNDCVGEADSVGSCFPKECPVHGKWSEYGQYSACSVTCGSGTQTRSRTCTNPAPAHGGNDCVGEADSVGSCFPKECPVHGKWSDYGDFGACSKTCGDGTKERTRSCNNPAPAHGGNDCSGNAADVESCNEKACGACVNLGKVAFSYATTKTSRKVSGVFNCDVLPQARCPNPIADDLKDDIVAKLDPHWDYTELPKIGNEYTLVKHVCCDRCKDWTGSEIIPTFG